MNVIAILLLQSIIMVSNAESPSKWVLASKINDFFSEFGKTYSIEQQEWQLRSNKARQDFGEYIEEMNRSIETNWSTDLKEKGHKWLELAQGLSQKTDAEIGDIKLKLPWAYRTILELIPGFSSGEHILRCFVYQTLDVTIHFVFSTKEETVKRELIIESSKILIENVANPLELTSKLVEFVLKYNNIPLENLAPKIRELIKMTNLTQELLKTIKDMKK